MFSKNKKIKLKDGSYVPGVLISKAEYDNLKMKAQVYGVFVKAIEDVQKVMRAQTLLANKK
jgi:hypothetical protein